MSTADTSLMTVEEFLALPEDGVDRELIRGELRERPMTYRNQFHCEVMGATTEVLRIWRRKSKEKWKVYVGDIGFLLDESSHTVVGIDIALVESSLMSKQSGATTLIEGAPTLAVEILSPSDKIEDIHERTHLFLENGVAVVWWLDPNDRTVRVCRPDQHPMLFNQSQELSGEPELPGLHVAVKDLFE